MSRLSYGRRRDSSGKAALNTIEDDRDMRIPVITIVPTQTAHTMAGLDMGISFPMCRIG